MPSRPLTSPGRTGPPELGRLLVRAVDEGGLEAGRARALGGALDDPGVRAAVLEAAAESKRRGKGDLVSVSKNVFIPLTNLCRDRCSYCSFAVTPEDPSARTYELEEVESVVRGGLRAGCTEALFCLGDKPEKAYRSHRQWLADRGLASTAEHLIRASERAFDLGMLPHTNAGILDAEQMAALRRSNASLGLMLETTSQRLRGKGGPHYLAPDKEPERRLRMHREAGELRIPFTSGILLGIGESAEERVDTLLAIRELDERYGHIQEVIVQPFHPKPGTPMAARPGLSVNQVAGWIAMARLILGPDMNVQAPPNLVAPGGLEKLLAAGLNDWGGVSPLTVDFINPEAPWPELRELARRSRAAGQRLKLRLPVYPEQLLGRPELFEPRVRDAALRLAGHDGFVPSESARGEAA